MMKCWQNPTLFYDKTQNKLDIERRYLSIINSVYDRPLAYIIVCDLKNKSKNLEDSFAKIRNMKNMPTLAAYIEFSTGSPTQSSLAGKRKKSHSNQKGRNKIVPVCVWHDVI